LGVKLRTAGGSEIDALVYTALMLLATITDPYSIILIQLFDGLGAAVFGVLTPLVVSDIARGDCPERVSPFSEPIGITDHCVLGPSNSRLTADPTMPRDHPE
jgi:hypothetical protein